MSPARLVPIALSLAGVLVAPSPCSGGGGPERAEIVLSELHSWIKAEHPNSNPAHSRGAGPVWTEGPFDVTFSVIASTEVRHLFVDRFETGDTWSWSATAP